MPVFVRRGAARQESVVCHYEGLQCFLDERSKGDDKIDKTVAEFFALYSFLGVTVGETGLAGSRELAVVVWDVARICNVWGVDAKAYESLGIRLSVVCPVKAHRHMEGVGRDILLSWATRGPLGEQRQKTPAGCQTSWFFPLFQCLTNETSFVTATFNLGRAQTELDK